MGRAMPKVVLRQDKAVGGIIGDQPAHKVRVAHCCCMGAGCESKGALLEGARGQGMVLEI